MNMKFIGIGTISNKKALLLRGSIISFSPNKRLQFHVHLRFFILKHNDLCIESENLRKLAWCLEVAIVSTTLSSAANSALSRGCGLLHE